MSKKMLISIWMMVLVTIVINAGNVFAADIFFSKDLKLGDKDQSVVLLQNFLNSDSDTTVALSGAGSVGNETDYFGNLTKTAVIKFQNIFKEEILYPIGLEYGTGYFGKRTRDKANQLLTDYFDNQDVVKSQSKDSNISEKNDYEIKNKDNEIFNVTKLDNKKVVESVYKSGGFYILMLSNRVAKGGDYISAVVNNFDVDFDLFMNDIQIEKSYYTSSTSIQFILDEEIEAGDYNITAVNSDGLITPPIKLTILDNDVAEPVIDDVSKKVVQYGDDIVIKGSGFLGENTIVTLLGQYSVISDSDDEIYLELKDPFRGVFDDNNDDMNLPGIIQVKNKNGDSNLFEINYVFR